ncbi:MAG: mucin desulfatase, partial [Lentisphaeria bacterium]|nr:mucin desulfatase [Lentisphaeria bacterium]
MSLTQAELREIVNNFIVYGDFLVGVPFGGGHVNDTYQLTFDQGGVRLYYILQRINHNAFRHPEQVMENLDRVTAHLLEKIHAAHIETRRRTIRLLRTPAGKSYTYDRCGNCWRAYVFIANARAYDVLETPEQAFRIAQTIGEFQLNLIDLPGKRLHETIPNFHNTPKRLE